LCTAQWLNFPKFRRRYLLPSSALLIKVDASVKRRKNGVGDTGLFDVELCSKFWTVLGGGGGKLGPQKKQL
jgi:hypothetical protein